MMRVKMVVAVVAILGVLFGLAPQALANGAAGGAGACQVKNPRGGAIAVRGTVAVTAANAYVNTGGFFSLNTGLVNVDITLRAEKGSVSDVFRLQLLVQPILDFIGSNEVMACLFLDPNSTGTFIQGVADFVQSIVTRLGLPATTRFVITNKSISNAQSPTQQNLQVPATTSATSVADIVFYTE